MQLPLMIKVFTLPRQCWLFWQIELTISCIVYVLGFVRSVAKHLQNTVWDQAWNHTGVYEKSKKKLYFSMGENMANLCIWNTLETFAMVSWFQFHDNGFVTETFFNILVLFANFWPVNFVKPCGKEGWFTNLYLLCLVKTLCHAN